MPTKTFSLSSAALAYLETIKGKNPSVVMNNLVLEHRGLSPSIKKQEALLKLREAAWKLATDHDLEQEAIISYVIAAIGGK